MMKLRLTLALQSGVALAMLSGCGGASESSGGEVQLRESLETPPETSCEPDPDSGCDNCTTVRCYGENEVTCLPVSAEVELEEQGVLFPSSIRQENLQASDGGPYRGTDEKEGQCCYLIHSVQCIAIGRPLVIEEQFSVASVVKRSDWKRQV